MEIYFLSSFKRAYKKLRGYEKAQVDDALAIFHENPFAPRLNNHKLKGRKGDVRALVAGYDLRILYREGKESGTAVVIMVGTHEEVY
ncbi:MAG: hypothetical protein PHW10_05365 [Candidatus Peribacteraceae bacterium]|nr:hypothetical protein [Candidatus Peribacteraceae bacterium]